MNLGKIISSIIKRLYLFFQPKSEFNDSVIETPINLPQNYYLALLKSFFPYKVMITMNERIVENPFVFMNLDLPKGAKILEVGCCRSKIALELASLGYKVTAIDLKHYKYKHPNLTFIQGDLRFIKLTEKFDLVTSVSTIEHTGLGSYKEKKSMTGDMEMIDKIHRLLKKKGKLIVTLPFGKYEIINNFSKIYDYKNIKKLLRKFKVLNIEYYKGLNRSYWIPTDPKDLQNTSLHKNDFIQGVVCILAQKQT